MEDAKETQKKIVSLLRTKGPCVPVKVAGGVGISSIFAGAFLSELYRENQVKISTMKVGGSPLYYLPGQENMLDNFYEFLGSKEKEAFLLLRDSKILSDKEQLPAIRVALRYLKDFAVSFKKDEETWWRFHSVSEEDVRGLLEPKKEEPAQNQEKSEKKEEKQEEAKAEEKRIEQIEAKKEEPAQDPEKIVEKEEEIEKPLEIEKKPRKPKIPKETKAEKIIEKPVGQRLDIFENPLVIPEPPKKIKPKSGFVLDVIEKLTSRYKIIEELDYKPKEYKCLLQAKSELGPINFLAFTKNKKRTSEEDLRRLLSEAQKIPLPALFVHNGELNKKAAEYAEKYFSILKVQKIRDL